MKRLSVVLLILLGLMFAPAALATSSGAAYADAQHWARYVCPNLCLGVYGSAIYDVNPYATAGHVQWDTYTSEATNFIGRCEVIQIFAQFGPFSGSGTATPLYWNTRFVRYC